MLGRKAARRWIVILGAGLLSTASLSAATDLVIVLDPPGPDYIVGTSLWARITSYGRTDCPPESQGKGPWVRTGRRQFLWTLKQDKPNIVTTCPISGTITPFDRMRIDTSSSVGGSFNIDARVQEEWRDSTGRTIFWPPLKN